MDAIGSSAAPIPFSIECFSRPTYYAVRPAVKPRTTSCNFFHFFTNSFRHSDTQTEMTSAETTPNTHGTEWVATKLTLRCAQGDDLDSGQAWVHPDTLADLGTIADGVVQVGTSALSVDASTLGPALGARAVVEAIAADAHRLVDASTIVVTSSLARALRVQPGAAVQLWLPLHRSLSDPDPATRWIYPHEVTVTLRSSQELEALFRGESSEVGLGKIALGQFARVLDSRAVVDGGCVGVCTVLRHTVEYCVQVTLNGSNDAASTVVHGTLCRFKGVEDMSAAIKWVGAADKSCQPRDVPPVATYFGEQHRELDALAAGLTRPTLAVIAGPIGSGKKECARQYADSRKFDYCEAEGVSDSASTATLQDKIFSACSRAAARSVKTLVLVNVSGLVAGPKTFSRQVAQISMELNRVPFQVGCLVLLYVHSDEAIQTTTNHEHVIWMGAPSTHSDRLVMFTELSARDEGTTPGLHLQEEALARVALQAQGFNRQDCRKLCRKLWRLSVLKDGLDCTPSLTTPIAWDHYLSDIRSHAPPRVLDVQLATEIRPRCWDDFCGYGAVKERLVALLSSLRQGNPDSRSGMSRQPSGLLLHGVSGCGKSLLAETAIANCGVSVVSVVAPTLVSKYVGDTELQIRSLFHTARQCRPSVIFIDEIDALIQKRGHASGTTGVSLCP